MPRSLSLSPDFQDMIECFLEEEVRFIVVGAYAMAVHGYVRATGDIDFFVEPTDENAAKVYNALVRFGAPLAGIVQQDFSTEGTVFQMGLSPFRIDIITKIEGVSFEEAWHDAVYPEGDVTKVPFLSLQNLIKNKKSTGRDKDTVDARKMERLLQGK
ncbi:MAG TPA: hypothetical protein PK544_16035 [Spirochaetota bacterium]|nr:hypothetical protein [Spirochaetota bacterium]